MKSIAAKLKSGEGRAAEQRQRVGEGLQKIGSRAAEQLQKLNLAKAIDRMEKNQNLADQLESLNERFREERERRDIQRTAEQACLQSMKDHIEEFLQMRPDATYEQWIEDLHPENAHAGKLLADLDKEIDLRFYIEESDHRKLWNSYHEDDPLRFVNARTSMWDDNKIEGKVDLLDSERLVPASRGQEEGDNEPLEEVDLISF